MVKVPVSELKAKLASYLRLIKSGERVEVQERGVPIAVISRLNTEESLSILPPRRNSKLFGQIKTRVRVDAVDAVQMLLDDRDRR